MKKVTLIVLFLFSFSCFSKTQINELQIKSDGYAYKKINQYMTAFFQKVADQKNFETVEKNFYSYKRVFKNIGQTVKPCRQSSKKDFNKQCSLTISRLVRVVERGETYYYARVELKRRNTKKNLVYKNCFILRERKQGLKIHSLNPSCFATF